MLNKIFWAVVALATIGWTVKPSRTGNTQMRPYKAIDTPVMSDIERLQKENLELNRTIKDNIHFSKPEVIYKTKVVEKNPKSIILYVRNRRGEIYEYKIKSHSGYFIVDDTLFKNIEKDTVVEFVEEEEHLPQEEEPKKRRFVLPWRNN